MPNRGRDGFWALFLRSAGGLWLLSMAFGLAAAEAPAPRCADPDEDTYLLATPQIPDPLCPLSHALSAATTMKVRSAVVTVADPLETHLGRAFDSQLSALIRSFDAKGYVLDGFALTWRLIRLDPAQSAGSRIPQDGTASFAAQQRERPSVLVFRKDLWRASDTDLQIKGKAPSSEYFVVFLVGESPTFGIHPHAFKDSVRCAARLRGSIDGAVEAGRLSRPCNAAWPDASSEQGELKILGPSFSGSMDSLALVLGDALKAQSGLSVELRSPSATVGSNARVVELIENIAGTAGRVNYFPLAVSLKDQLDSLAVHLQQQGIDGDVLILAEASTFGHGVADLLDRERARIRANDSTDADTGENTDAEIDVWASFVDHARVTSFPQNIAAIRAEHARIDKQESEPLRNLLKVQRSLLELDLSGVDENIDRPPAYRRELSTRSDELMLYGTFDALRVWVDPAVVVIVATDVRDRLFLLNEVRKSLPTALPVLMEMDYLTAHPDYRKISRGALVVPSGPTVLRVDENGSLTNRWRGVTYLSFPADYAANMFRAIVGLIERTRPEAPDSTSQVWVTTLAGFQTADKGRSRLLAAEGRMLLERPLSAFYFAVGLFVAVVGGWLLLFGRAHLVMLSPLRDMNLFSGFRETGRASEAADAESAQVDDAPIHVHRVLSVLLLALGTLVVVIAGVRLYASLFLPARELTWSIAHGRDQLMLIGLFLVYLCVAVLAGWRLYLWCRRCRGQLDTLAGAVGMPGLDRNGSGPSGMALSIAILGIVGLLAFAGFHGVPIAADPIWPVMGVDLLLLVLGVGFMAATWSESRRLAWFAQLLAPTADDPAMASEGAEKSVGDAGSRGSWATPLRLHALPQSPFSVSFRRRDLQTFLDDPSAAWCARSAALLSGTRPFESASGSDVSAWQHRLVAELRYGLVAVRSCAWAAILAPTAILLGMALYPPFAERTMTTASVVLILLGFALVMYVVIRLENHPLLGRLFTEHGDRLSIGAAVGALWGKLAMAAVILIPVLFPDVLSGFYGLLQSINSLQ